MMFLRTIFNEMFFSYTDRDRTQGQVCQGRQHVRSNDPPGHVTWLLSWSSDACKSARRAKRHFKCHVLCNYRRCVSALSLSNISDLEPLIRVLWFSKAMNESSHLRRWLGIEFAINRYFIAVGKHYLVVYPWSSSSATPAWCMASTER